MKKPIIEDDSNGHRDQEELGTILRSFGSSLKELSERLDEIDENSKRDASGESRLKLTNMIYDTPDNRLLELTVISSFAAIKSYARSIMLEHQHDPDVRSGKIKLSEIYRNAIFRLVRSQHGLQLMRGSALAREQVQNEGEDEEFNRMRLGAGIE